MAKASAAYRDADAELPGRDIALRYRDWGGDGPPIVLLHGLSSSLRIWDFVAPMLARRCHVYAVDQRGHGLSSKPDDGYGFAEVTGDLAAFIETLGIERPLIVGHSWGANVAVQFAADHPDVPCGVVLVDGGFIARPEGSTWEKAEQEMRPPEIDGAPVERFVQMMSQWPSLKDSWRPELEGMILYNFEVRDGKIYRRLNIPNHMKIARAIFDQRPTELLQRVRCPVLIIPALREASSEQEQNWQEYRRLGLEAIQQSTANVEVLPMQDTIHDVPIQRPRDLAEAIETFAAKTGVSV